MEDGLVHLESNGGSSSDCVSRSLASGCSPSVAPQIVGPRGDGRVHVAVLTDILVGGCGRAACNQAGEAVWNTSWSAG